jgi:ABC-2 type transport system permease protein
VSERPSQGVIHDQGYQRYRGDRRPQGRRFLVIARNVLASAWKQKWSVKAPIWLTVIAVVVAAGVLVIRAQLAQMGRVMPFSPVSVLMFVSAFFTIFGFVLSATVAVPAVADDLRSGAFYFYFARPLRTGDYVRGKLLGLLALVGLCTLSGPFLLGLIQLALSETAADAVDQLPLVGKAMAMGIASTFALTLPAAALGALIGKRAPAMAAYIVYYVVLSGIFETMANVMRVPAISLLSIRANIEAISRGLFDRSGDPSHPGAIAAWAALVAFSAAGYLLMSWRVRSAESAGLGGG